MSKACKAYGVVYVYVDMISGFYDECIWVILMYWLGLLCFEHLLVFFWGLIIHYGFLSLLLSVRLCFSLITSWVDAFVVLFSYGCVIFVCVTWWIFSDFVFGSFSCKKVYKEWCFHAFQRDRISDLSSRPSFIVPQRVFLLSWWSCLSGKSRVFLWLFHPYKKFGWSLSFKKNQAVKAFDLYWCVSPLGFCY